jgi:hypothetical protein
MEFCQPVLQRIQQRYPHVRPEDATVRAIGHNQWLFEHKAERLSFRLRATNPVQARYEGWRRFLAEKNYRRNRRADVGRGAVYVVVSFIFCGLLGAVMKTVPDQPGPALVFVTGSVAILGGVLWLVSRIMDTGGVAGTRTHLS